MIAAMPQPFESALDWNRRHPPGSRVLVRLADGRDVSTRTASWAQQGGSFAVLSLAQMDGLWTTRALVPVGDLFDDAADQGEPQ